MIIARGIRHELKSSGNSIVGGSHEHEMIAVPFEYRQAVLFHLIDAFVVHELLPLMGIVHVLEE